MIGQKSDTWLRNWNPNCYWRAKPRPLPAFIFERHEN